jgi:hypothetical protein
MISRLDANTPEARQSVYASLRAAFVALMGPQDASPTSVEKYDREHRDLQLAQQVEATARAKLTVPQLAERRCR